MSATITPANVRKTVTVRASREKAFHVFTENFGDWWPKSHSIGESPLKRAVIEPGVGGRWYGLLESGVEALWGDVLFWDPPSRLVLAWRINAKWTYDPALTTEVEVRFTDEGEGLTRVDFEHRNLERLGADADETRAMLDSPDGWGALMQLFKQAAEA